MPKKLDSSEIDLTNYKYPDKFGKWLGYEVLKYDRKKHRAETGLKIRKDHLSPAGRVHGGVISGFFDFSCGVAVFSTMNKGDFCSTVELKVNYLRPIDLGDHLIAKTQVVFRGKKLCVIHGFIYKKDTKTGRQERKPIAMATATFNIVSPS
ncbi:MAG: PaaI family thioesterase [Bacteroidota bacterium]